MHSAPGFACLKFLAYASVLGASLSAPQQARAFGFDECTGGTPQTVPGAQMVIAISDVSFPPGSPFDSRLHVAMFNWNAVVGSRFQFFVARDVDGTFALGNGVNEAFFATDDDSDALAYVRTRTSGCTAIVEADVLFQSRESWTTAPFDPFDSAINFELVALHEFGHALGLGHEDRIQATMNSIYPMGCPAGHLRDNRVVPFGDDRVGVRFLYPDAGTERGIAASACKRRQSNGGATASPLAVCKGSSARCGLSSELLVDSGETVTLEYTFSNLGTATESFDVGVYLSENERISRADHRLGTDSWSVVSPGSTQTRSKTVAIPGGLAPGRYRIGFVVDDARVVNESKFFDTEGAVLSTALLVSSADTDGDGVVDGVDNCQFDFNPGQADQDGDGIGDACDAFTDRDGDGVSDESDNCPLQANPDQVDTDGDGIGDACDASSDRDDDGIPDASDNCPFDFNPGQTDSDADGVGDVCEGVAASRSDLIADFGPAIGMWSLRTGGIWEKVNDLSPEIIVSGTLDGNGSGDLVLSFGPGIGTYVLRDQTTWTKINDLSPELVATGDLDGNGHDEIVLDFGPVFGVWIVRNSTAWQKLNDLSPSAMLMADLDGNGRDELILGFGPGIGTWLVRNDATWEKLHEQSPGLLVGGDLDGNGREEIVADFGAGLGMWILRNDTTWSKLNDLSAQLMVSGDVDGSGRDDLVVDFGAGIGVWLLRDDAVWEKLNDVSPHGMATGNVDGAGDDDVVFDFGPGIGTWLLRDGAAWSKLNDLSAEIIVTTPGSTGASSSPVK